MSQYVIDPAWGQERERLALLEEWTDPMSERRLGALGVGEGWHCLEAGAGSGSMASWLADRVGPSGRVVAVDLDTRFVEARGDDRVEVVRGDVLRDELPQQAFDVVHARALIHHLDDPVLGLRRLVGCLKPGGRVLIEEPDSFAALTSPHQAWCAAWATLERIPGVDITYGRRLVGDLRSAGVEDVDAEIEVHVARGGTRLARFHVLSVEALRPLILATGTMTGDVLDALLADLGRSDFLEPSFAWVAASGRV